MRSPFRSRQQHDHPQTHTRPQGSGSDQQAAEHVQQGKAAECGKEGKVSIDFLPNRAGPEQREQAAKAAAVRQRLLASPPPAKRIYLPPPAAEEAEIDEVTSVSIKAIVAAGCFKHKVSTRELGTRIRRAARCRDELCWELRKLKINGYPMSLANIAKVFDVHHTTVMHAINRHAARLSGEVA